MAKKIKEDEYTIRWVDTYFNNNFNGRITSKSLKPHLTMNSAEVDAARMLGNDRVQELIELKREHIRQKEEIKLSDIVSKLKSIIYEVDSEGEERDENGRLIQRKDRKSQLAAIAQLSKLAGFETKKVDVTTNGENINQITWIEEKQYPKNETND